MKKIYTKPAVVFEDFALSTNIAAVKCMQMPTEVYVAVNLSPD